MPCAVLRFAFHLLRCHKKRLRRLWLKLLNCPRNRDETFHVLCLPFRCDVTCASIVYACKSVGFTRITFVSREDRSLIVMLFCCRYTAKGWSSVSTKTMATSHAPDILGWWDTLLEVCASLEVALSLKNIL